jgi:hypothetical protein
MENTFDRQVASISRQLASLVARHPPPLPPRPPRTEQRRGSSRPLPPRPPKRPHRRRG